MNREKLQQLGHLVAGIIILVYGFDSFEAGDFASATYYLTLAIIFLIVAGTHKWITQKFVGADVAFNFLEAITIIYTGWHYKQKGHPVLFYSMAVAGALYFIFALINMFLPKERKRRSSKRKKRRRRSSELFKEEGLPNDEN